MKKSTIFAKRKMSSLSMETTPKDNREVTEQKSVRVEHSGIAKLRWRKLNVPAVKSEIIIGGVDNFGA